MLDPIYLDYNATAPVRPAVARAMAESLGRVGNASSLHRFGREARAAVEGARGEVAALVGAAPEEVHFTAGGTEADNWALTGFGARRLLVSAGEHEAVLEAAPQAERIPLTGGGLVDLAALERLLAASDAPALVSVQAANNETGALQPLPEVAALARRHGALLHSDAVQAAGKTPLDRAALGLDLVSLSAHKLGGPQGVGALVVRAGLELAPLLRGGGQERRRRAGTENVAGIVGFGLAARLAAAELADMAARAAWRDAFEAGLRARFPEAVVFAAAAPRLPNTSCFALPGRSAETLLIALDLAGVALSSGSACSSGKIAPSHVLAAMGVPETLARSALRLSFGWASRREDLEACLAALAKQAGSRQNGAGSKQRIIA
ncbi:MAG: cysteine desulfurase family protein [Tistlia sp.]|uniref:cysteine desulfurase family protein n=1 Tax=Tistlia sp. TaxID=3057121 RepID=UPI0034A241AC